MPLRLRPFPPELADQVSRWATTDDEVDQWCARPTAPVPAEQINQWAEDPTVRPHGLFHDDRLVAYGELWLDEDEQETELARLIVDPAERGHGIGRRLVVELTTLALTHYPQVIMRVHPDNASALRCYAGAGFVAVAPDLAAQWNAEQPREYVWLIAAPQRVATTRTIAAPASAIFAVVSDPHGHVRIDGSGMLVAADADARPATAVGDAFEMDMDRAALGDHPMGRYRTRNVVTRVEPDRLFEWAVGSVEGQLLGHVYGYELEPTADGTVVTSYCDWSAVPAAAKARIRWPVVPLDRLERSLANLDTLVTSDT
jgi:hypothetical protein